MSNFYYRERDEVQRLYYEFQRTQGRGARMFPFIDRPDQQYLAKYLLMNEFHRKLHPFRFLRQGDHALMVGVSDGYIELGVSTLFIMSALVGDSGHIWAVEPDERNIAAIQSFSNENRIGNVSIISKAVWKEPAQLEFVNFSDFSSSNMAAEQFSRKREMLNQVWGRQRAERETYTSIVEADSIDNIITNDIKQPIDFINLTINGTESDALTGAAEVLKNPDMRIAFPMQNLNDPLYQILNNNGYKIAVADAPTKAWETKQFLYGLAAKFDQDDLIADGYFPAEFEMDPDVPQRFNVTLTGRKAG